MHGNLELTNTKESFTHSPSVAYGASSLPEGAFDTRTFCAYFLFVFSLSAEPLLNPDTMAGFSLYNKRPRPPFSAMGEVFIQLARPCPKDLI